MSLKFGHFQTHESEFQNHWVNFVSIEKFFQEVRTHGLKSVGFFLFVNDRGAARRLLIARIITLVWNDRGAPRRFSITRIIALVCE